MALGCTYPMVSFEKLVVSTTVLATSVIHCPGSRCMFSIIALNKVDFPVDEGPIRYRALISVALAFISIAARVRVEVEVKSSARCRRSSTMKTILLENPPPDQDEWKFHVPEHQLEPRRPAKVGKIFGKRITFSATAITLEIGELPNNRILQDDDPSKFIAVSFGGLRFPDSFLRVTGEYIQRLMRVGLYLNGTQYRFYHHSNSQLVSTLRYCYFHYESHDTSNRENEVASCAPRTLMRSWIIGYI